MSDGFLHKYFLNNPGRRLHKWTHYFDIYERHFERFRGKSPIVLEIGVFGGGSLDMWKAYFGPGVQIIGLDINPECKKLEGPSIEIFIGSQDDENTLNSIKQKYGAFDIVIDDGSHMMSHMIKSFELLYEAVKEDGIYMVEDTHTCYWADYEGGLKREGSFLEFAKNKVDELHAAFSQGQVPISNFTRSTDYIAFYDSIVVFEKRRQTKRGAGITHAM